MTDPTATLELDFSSRDITILKARIKYPTASVRELQTVLDEEYGISLSHNRINDILREIQSDGLYRFLATPNAALFRQYLFRVSFHYPEFEERWDDCHSDLLRDPHVVLFFSANAYHQWQFVTQFRSEDTSEEWQVDFFNKHGDVIADIEKTALEEIHKFEMDPRVFDDVLRERDDGDQFLESD